MDLLWRDGVTSENYAFCLEGVQTKVFTASWFLGLLSGKGGCSLRRSLDKQAVVRANKGMECSH